MIHALWLVLTYDTYDLLGEIRMDDITINKNFALLSFKTNRFYVAVGLHSYRSQKMS